MNAKVEQSTGNSAIDLVKLSLAGLLIVAGLVGFYYFAGAWTTALRIVALIGAFVLAGVVGAATHTGRSLRVFISESQFELRKVVLIEASGNDPFIVMPSAPHPQRLRGRADPGGHRGDRKSVV